MLRPGSDAHFCWTACLNCGDFESAWRITDAIESRREEYADERLVWDGSPFAGRRVLVECHRSDDAIQFVRYAILLKHAGATHVSVSAATNLLPLLRTAPGVDEAISSGEHDQEAVSIECSELPYAFRTTLHTVPALVPYFDVAGGPPEGDIGVVWSPELQPLYDIPGVTVLRGIDFADAAESAELMLRLSLIIAPDSVAAHVAGALGRPVWTLLPRKAHWRWMLRRSESPWYPTMRLFRGEWSDVIARVRAELAAELRASAVSW